jgi:hypothetical protein
MRAGPRRFRTPLAFSNGLRLARERSDSSRNSEQVSRAVSRHRGMRKVAIAAPTRALTAARINQDA